MNDPHLLAQLFIMLGIVVVVGAWRNPIRIVLSLSLLAIALMTKQTLLAAPLAVVLTLLAENRSRLFFVIGACVLIASITVTILYVTIGSAIFEGLLYSSKRNVLVWHGIVRTVPNILILQVGGIFALLSCIMTLDNVNGRFMSIYLILAAIFGLLWSATFGGDINHWFDLLVAISLASGWGLSRLCAAIEGRNLCPTTKFAAALLPFLLFMQIPSQAAMFLKSPAAYQQEYTERERLTEDGISYLRGRNGPVLCQDGVLCYWSGHRTIPVPWLGKTMIGDVSAERPDALSDDLVEKVQNKYFAVVQVGVDRKSAEAYHFPPGFFNSLDKYYVRDYENRSGAFFLRKGTEEGR